MFSELNLNPFDHNPYINLGPYFNVLNKYVSSQSRMELTQC